MDMGVDDYDDDDHIIELAKAAGLPTKRFPETKQEVDLIENLLAKEMEKLSLDEREKILFDVHGFVDFEEEDPVTVDLRLKELDEELAKIQEKEAYMLALKMNETYVTSRKFRLMFLRREQLNVKAAAVLVVKHFEMKRRLFGSGEILGRNVLQSDLKIEERLLLEFGYFQVLAKRDVAGRTVFVVTSIVTNLQSPTWNFKMDHRIAWYLGNVALQDEETQKKGIVWILIQCSDFSITPSQFRDMQEVERCIPYRVAGGHFCYFDPSWRRLAAGVQLFSGSNERYRTRIHYGTQKEVYFTLQTFGIPIEDIKLTDGVFDATEHREFLAMLRTQEDADKGRGSIVSCSKESEQDHIIVPGRFDVLFGKTRFAKEHTGTKRALHMVEMEFDTYERLSKFQKADVADRIISIIRQSGGRFLRQNEAKAWVVADDEDAKKKIGHWFRHARTKRTATRNSEEVSSNTNIQGPGMTQLRRSATKRLAPPVSHEALPVAVPVEAIQL